MINVTQDTNNQGNQAKLNLELYKRMEAEYRDLLKKIQVKSDELARQRGER